MIERFLCVLVILAVFGSVQPAVAGLYINIDIGDNGVDSSFGTTSDPGVQNLGAQGDGLIVNATVFQSESSAVSAVGSSNVGIDINALGAPATDRVRVRVLFSDVDLPGGTPLTLLSNVSSSTPSTLVSASNLAFLEDSVSVSGNIITVPGSGGLLAQIPDGNVVSDTEEDTRNRPGLNFDLLSDLLIIFRQVDNVFVQAGGTTSVTPVPEASSIIVWASVFGFAFVGYVVRRYRTR